MRLAAKVAVRKKVNYYAEIMGVHPRSVHITSARTRWGSCGPKDNICFSWRLVFVDDHLFDYVVVHELSHILRHDHSPHFWAVVEKYMPDYPARRNELRAFSKNLVVSNW